VSDQPWAASSIAEMTDRASAWLFGHALRHLVDDLGGPTPSVEALDQLRAWSAALDTRGGAERRDAPPVTIQDQTRAALITAAQPLGLLCTAPATRDQYDLVVVLAGATTGNQRRTQLAHDTLGQIAAGALVALASGRQISDSEVADDPRSADDATEWRNLERYVDSRFGPLSFESADGGATWHDRKLRTAHGLSVRVIVAPEHGGRRPTTTQQLQFLRQRVPVGRRRSVLLITSAIYAPYQFFAGAPELVTDGGAWVELIGTETATDGDANRLAQRLAQEIHAGMQAAVALVARTRGPG
jgi:hypothetical protein